MERIKNHRALGRPDAAGGGDACCHLGLAGKQAGIKKGPEPSHEKHHFRGDEHQHAITQMNANNGGVVTGMGLGDHITPPHEHGIENQGQANA